MISIADHTAGDNALNFFCNKFMDHINKKVYFGYNLFEFAGHIKTKYSIQIEISIIGPRTTDHLDNFFFIVSKGGPKEKCWKTDV